LAILDELMERPPSFAADHSQSRPPRTDPPQVALRRCRDGSKELCERAPPAR